MPSPPARCVASSVALGLLTVAFLGACGGKGSDKGRTDRLDLKTPNLGQLARGDPEAGGLDASFGQAGKVTHDFPGTDDDASAVVTTPDGGIVVAGTSGKSDGAGLDAIVIRYREDGSLDGAFGRSGIARVDVAGRKNAVGGILLEPGGRLLLLGSAEGADGAPTASLTRLRRNGALDRSFGRGGTVTLAVSAFRSDCAGFSAGTLMGDGRIVAAGGIGCGGEKGGDRAIGVARFLPDGRLDDAFGRHGVSTAAAACGVAGVAVQADAKVLLGASTGDRRACESGSMAFLRLNGDGTRDVSFAPHGLRLVEFASGAGSAALAMRVDERGRPVLAGRADARLAVARLTPDGLPDRSFNGDGRAAYAAPRGGSAYGVDILPGPDDHLTVAANQASDAGGQFLVLRLLGDGTLDRSWAAGGIQTVSFGTASAAAVAAALDSRQRIVVVGFVRADATGEDGFAIARLR